MPKIVTDYIIIIIKNIINCRQIKYIYIINVLSIK